MKSKNTLLNNIAFNFKNKNAICVIFAGMVEYPLFIVLPPPMKMGLAVGLIPIFFFMCGLLLALALWILQKLTKLRLSLVFYIFIIGLIVWQVIAALGYYFDFL